MANLSYRTALRNIRKVYTLATPEEIETGRAWYQNAHEHAVTLSATYHIPIDAASDIIAALSPNVRWERNLVDAYTLCAVLASGGELESIRVLTYGANRAKAGEIFCTAVNGASYAGILSGPKVTRFARTIAEPWGEHGVVIDAHAFSVASGRRHTVDTAVVGTVDYRTCERAYKTVGAELGIPGHQIQAITWTVWKRLHKV